MKILFINIQTKLPWHDLDGQIQQKFSQQYLRHLPQTVSPNNNKTKSLKSRERGELKLNR